MAVYRYLPIPSSRMGFLWAVTNIPGVAVLEFGPMGTTNFATRHMEEAPIYSTHISDSVLTFGDSAPLRRAVLELEERTAPRMIYVMQSAVTSIIGFDMEAFCRELQPEVQARLVPVILSGLTGDYTLGLAQGMRSLVEEWVGPGLRKKPVFHILGAAIDDTRIRPDVAELTRLMEGAFGWSAGLVLPCGASIRALQTAGEGGISLVLRKEALPAAQLLQERAGIPYVEGVPVGIQGTLDWLRRVGAVCAREPAADFVERELAELRALPTPEPEGVCVVSGSSMACALGRFFRQELGVSRCGAFVFEKNWKPADGENAAPYSEAALDQWIAENRPAVLLGNSVVTERDFGYPARRIAIRKPAGIPRQDDPPVEEGFLGWRGYRNLLNAVGDTRLL